MLTLRLRGGRMPAPQLLPRLQPHPHPCWLRPAQESDGIQARLPPATSSTAGFSVMGGATTSSPPVPPETPPAPGPSRAFWPWPASPAARAPWWLTHGGPVNPPVVRGGPGNPPAPTAPHIPRRQLPPPPDRPNAINPRRVNKDIGPPVSTRPGKYPQSATPATDPRRGSQLALAQHQSRGRIPEFTQGKHPPPPPNGPRPAIRLAGCPPPPVQHSTAARALPRAAQHCRTGAH